MISKRNHLCEDYKVTDKIAIAFGTRYFYVSATFFPNQPVINFITWSHELYKNNLQGYKS